MTRGSTQFNQHAPPRLLAFGLARVPPRVLLLGAFTPRTAAFRHMFRVRPCRPAIAAKRHRTPSFAAPSNVLHFIVSPPRPCARLPDSHEGGVRAVAYLRPPGWLYPCRAGRQRQPNRSSKPPATRRPRGAPHRFHTGPPSFLTHLLLLESCGACPAPVSGGSPELTPAQAPFCLGLDARCAPVWTASQCTLRRPPFSALRLRHVGAPTPFVSHPGPSTMTFPLRTPLRGLGC